VRQESCSIPSLRQPPSVDRKGRAGYIAGIGREEIKGSRGHLAWLGEPARRNSFQE